MRKGVDVGTGAGAKRTLEQVRRWANELIDLSRRNTSLYYRPLKRGTLRFIAPAPVTIHDLLGQAAGATEAHALCSELLHGRAGACALPGRGRRRNSATGHRRDIGDPAGAAARSSCLRFC
jgi:hypothetical protein